MPRVPRPDNPAWSPRGRLRIRGAAAPHARYLRQVGRAEVVGVRGHGAVVLEAQAALAAALSTAFVVPFVTPAWDGGGLRGFGAMIAAAGVAGEAFADAPLRKFVPLPPK